MKSNTTLPSIPKVYRINATQNADIWSGHVVIEEKIDGSQFSFGQIAETGDEPKLVCRSKGQMINPDNAGMFSDAYATALKLFKDDLLPTGYIFQCEYLAKPHHNILKYSRIPKRHLCLFDVVDDNGEYETPNHKADWATILDIDCVPLIWQGQATHPNPESFMAQDSYLGGTTIEGVVIKNYGLRHPESRDRFAPMTAKFVSPKFQETKACSPSSPIKERGNGDIVKAIINSLRTEARWLKAIQHLRERGELKNAPEDIGKLIRELQEDTIKEEREWIAEKLLQDALPAIRKGVMEGFPQFYLNFLQSGPSVYQQQKMRQ